MALVKGTNAYQDAADALAYHDDRITAARWGVIVTAGTNEQKENVPLYHCIVP